MAVMARRDLVRASTARSPRFSKMLHRARSVSSRIARDHRTLNSPVSASESSVFLPRTLAREQASTSAVKRYVSTAQIRSASIVASSASASSRSRALLSL